MTKYRGYAASYLVQPDTLRESSLDWIVDVAVEIVTPSGATSLETYTVFADRVTEDAPQRIKEAIDRFVRLAKIRDELSIDRVIVY